MVTFVTSVTPRFGSRLAIQSPTTTIAIAASHDAAVRIWSGRPEASGALEVVVRRAELAGPLARSRAGGYAGGLDEDEPDF